MINRNVSPVDMIIVLQAYVDEYIGACASYRDPLQQNRSELLERVLAFLLSALHSLLSSTMRQQCLQVLGRLLAAVLPVHTAVMLTCALVVETLNLVT